MGMKFDCVCVNGTRITVKYITVKNLKTTHTFV